VNFGLIWYFAILVISLVQELLPIVFCFYEVTHCNVIEQSTVGSSPLYLANWTHKQWRRRFDAARVINSPTFRTLQHFTRTMTSKTVPIMVTIYLQWQQHKDTLAFISCIKHWNVRWTGWCTAIRHIFQLSKL